MYKVWEITEKEKGKHIITHWDGDCYTHTVLENEEEYEKEKERLAKIEKEYQKQKKEFLECKENIY